MTEYKGEIIYDLGKSYWWNGYVFKNIEEAKVCIDDFLKNKNENRK